MSQVNENMSNNSEKGDSLVVGPRENSHPVDPEAAEVEKNSEAEETHKNFLSGNGAFRR